MTTEMEVENGNYTLLKTYEQMRYAKYLMDRGLINESIKKAEHVVMAIQAIKEKGLPNSCLKDFYVVQGKLAMYGDTFLALMYSTGKVQELSIFFFDENGVEITIPKKGQVYFGCAIKVLRKGFTIPSLITYTTDDKDLSKTNNPTWNKFQRDMLFRRCAGRVNKWIFPDAVMGIEMVDYLEDVDAGKLNDIEKAKEATLVFSSNE
jgi:hypothetical protein